MSPNKHLPPDTGFSTCYHYSTPPNTTERRELTTRLHRTLDKALCRRLNAILLLDKGHSVSSTAALLAAGRSSVRR
ncbi:MAG: helix-turn-helix domain-containing protein, partial [Pseudomonadota bacterium]|nr:helix-turn-helix domain-containing protein [Pseudomonadota bacterium]